MEKRTLKVSLATKEDAEAFLAIMQLKRLRDQWWENLNWKPDYTDSSSYKYVIQLIRNEITIDYIHTINRFLVFPTKEVAEEFLLCFKDLIQKAKEFNMKEKFLTYPYSFPPIITYNNIDAYLVIDVHNNHKVKIAYFRLDKFKNYLLHETGAFYVVSKSEEESVIKMYNLLKEKNVI